MKFNDLTGKRFNRLVVIRLVPGLRSRWLCRCDCGTEKEISGGNIHRVKSCGCQAREDQHNPEFTDLTGSTFGHWAVLGEPKKKGANLWWNWKCRCTCGTTIYVSANKLRSGKSQSCGCVANLAHTGNRSTHCRTHTSEYGSWTHMRTRCQNPNSDCYGDYGERGITVCERWANSFENFLADMGEKPSRKHSLDRIDNDKGYSPDNCRWASSKEQARNKRTSRMITYNGETLALADWAERLGISFRTIASRLDLGMSVDEALTRPVKKRPRGRRSDCLRIWYGMIYRCHNPKDVSYSRYGGRGISVCERWRSSYKAFCADMGPRPSPDHSIDRIDNDGPYSPENCRWATKKEQANNRKNTPRTS